MPSQLYLGGRAATHPDFVSMGANMILLFMLALDDPINDKPLISQEIEKLVLLTRTQCYRQSIIFHTDPETGNKYFIMHLINAATEMAASLARNATSFELTTARKANDTPKINALYTQTRDFCERKTSKLKDTLDAADYQQFATQPRYYQHLPTTPTNATHSAAGAANQHNDSTASPPRKKGKHETNNNNSNNTPNNRNNSGSPQRNNGNSGNNNRGNNNATPTNGSTPSFGIIKPVNKPANWRPKIPANITGCFNGDPTAKKICPAFILTGASCTFHPNCNLLHLSTRNFRSTLDPTAQNNFIEWVNTSTEVEWANPNSVPQRNG
jgi:hypothetical protein